MEASQLQLLLEETGHFCNAIRSRAKKLQVYLDLARNRMDCDLVLAADRCMCSIKYGVKALHDEFEYLDARIYDWSVLEKEIQDLSEEVESLSATCQAKEILITVMNDNVGARKRQLTKS